MSLALLITLLSPVIGGFVYGVERILRARMQGRVGPPLLQPFYDFFKLLEKRSMVIHSFHAFMGLMYLLGTWFSLYVLLSGGDILIAIFFHLLSLAFLVVGGFSVRSPYSILGSMRELLHMVAYEPVFVLAAAGLYLVTGTFQISQILHSDKLPILYLPLVFVALLLTLPSVLKKSPFDVAEAHHTRRLSAAPRLSTRESSTRPSTQPSGLSTFTPSSSSSSLQEGAGGWELSLYSSPSSSST